MIGSLANEIQLLAQSNVTSPTEWRLNWDWRWPPWLTAMLCVGIALWVMAIYLRETSTAGRGKRVLLATLRMLAVTLALLMFAQPTLEWFQFTRPRLVVLVDRSGSMATFDRDAERAMEVSRIEAWQSLLVGDNSSLLERWQSDYQVDVVAFDEEITKLSEQEIPAVDRLRDITVGEGDLTGTRLGDAIDFALRDLVGPPPVAIIVLTDGINTRGRPLEQAALQARRMRTPIHFIGIGSPQPRPDIVLENLLVEEIVFPGDRLQVEATVRATGFAGEPADVVLRDSDQSILAKTTITLPADGATETVTVAIRPSQPGRLSLDLSVAPRDEEQNTENNRVSQSVDIRDEKIRVLLVDNRPTYEFRALKSLLERDPAVDLKVLLQEADSDYPTVDNVAIRGFPSGRSLSDYDVLMLGDVDVGLLPRAVWPAIERFVAEHGGGMVAIAGPQFMPLAFRGIRPLESLLPIGLSSANPLRRRVESRDEFAIYPTLLGWRTPSLQLGDTMEESRQRWRSLPKVTWMFKINEVKPGAQVLAECPEVSNLQGQRLPVILRQYVGAGEVLFHATDESWRWRWRSDDRYFARYWGQVVRRLGRGRLAAGRQGIRLTADRSTYEPGESVRLQARFRNPADAPADDEGVVVQLQRQIGPPQETTLTRRVGRRGLFEGTLDYLMPGEYEAQIVRPDLGDGVGDVTRFEIQQPPLELAQLVINQQGLREAADISGGEYYPINEASRLLEKLPPSRQQFVDERTPRKLWNSHMVVALFVIILSSEWLLRRRCGML